MFIKCFRTIFLCLNIDLEINWMFLLNYIEESF